MALWATNAFKKNQAPDDEFYTPDTLWHAIEDKIPKDKIIWEAFGNNPDLDSYKFMERHSTEKPLVCQGDFFNPSNKGWHTDNIIVTNPPFSIIDKIFLQLKHTEKPFIIVMPPQKIYTKYFNDIWQDELENICIISTHIRYDFYAINTTDKDIIVNDGHKRVKNPDYIEGKNTKTIPKKITIKPGDRYYKAGPPIVYMCYKMPFMDDMKKQKGVMNMIFQ